MSEAAGVDSTAPRRAPWALRAVVWLVLVIGVPILLMYWLIALTQREGAAPGGTNYHATATVESCARPASKLGLVTECTVQLHGVASGVQVNTHTLIAADPVTGSVPVVERCIGGGHGFGDSCFLYDSRLIRSVWWSWLAFLPLPVALLVWLSLRVRRMRRTGMIAGQRVPSADASPAGQ